MFRKKPKPAVEYAVVPDNNFNPFTPARNATPKWYKDVPPWGEDERWKMPQTYKQCLPFFDALTMGYMIYTPCDIWVRNEGDKKEFTWGSQAHEIIFRDFNSSTMDIPRQPEYNGQSIAWRLPVCLKVPEGYSYLLTHPINRFDLPFITMSGIIDGNYALPSHGNITFMIRKDFQGLIPQGTPIAQLIPYRHEEWNSIKNQNLIEEGETNRRASGSILQGWYKKVVWKRKKYN